MKFVRTTIGVLLFVLAVASISWAEIGYTLKEGESLEQVAAKFKVSLEALLDANEIEEPSAVFPGCRLIIPLESKQPDEKIVSEEKSGIVEYEIRKGDILSKIAKEYDCKVEDITKLNGFQKNKILHIGDVIKIPVEVTKESIFDLGYISSPRTDKPDNEIQINVDADKIAGKNLLNLEELGSIEIEVKQTEENNEPKSEDKIKEIETPKPAEKEVSKKSKPAFVEHRIEKGDTIEKIAKIYGVSQKSIFDANNISKRTTLSVGRKLKIPNPSDTSNNREIDDGLVSRNLPKRDQITRHALKYIGLRYRYSGTSLTSGVDCSGFVMKIFERYGIHLPHSSAQQSLLGKRVEKNQLIPGDLVFFKINGKTVSHVGIYIGNGKFVHATSTNGKVTVSSLSEEYYAKRYSSARRFL